MFRSTTLALTILAAMAASAQAQDESEPKGVLRGKVGRAIEARGDPEIAPREISLDRLNLPEEVRIAFLEKVERQLDDDEIETMRARRIERMQRKLGTTREEALAIRDDFGLDPRPAAKTPAKRPVVEEETERGLWLTLGSICALCGYVIFRMRRA